jgi:hypothetical protein
MGSLALLPGGSKYSGLEVLAVFAETIGFLTEVCQRWLVVNTWAWCRLFSGSLRRPLLRQLNIQPCGCPINTEICSAIPTVRDASVGRGLAKDRMPYEAVQSAYFLNGFV